MQPVGWVSDPPSSSPHRLLPRSPQLPDLRARGHNQREPNYPNKHHPGRNTSLPVTTRKFFS